MPKNPRKVHGARAHHGHNADQPCPAEDQAKDAADFLMHYHLEHTNDKVTRLVGKDGDVVITSDPEWRNRLRALLEYVFSDAPPIELPGVPTPETIARVEADIRAMGSAFEPFRSATANSMMASGALDQALKDIQEWVLSRGHSTPEDMAKTGISAIRGAILSGFQLGLCVARECTSPLTPAPANLQREPVTESSTGTTRARSNPKDRPC